MTPTDTVTAYAAAWHEPDEASRRALLETCWAEDAVYIDPRARAEGRDGLAAHIGTWQERMPGHRLETTSAVDEHDGHLRFRWTMYDAAGEELMDGMDYGELDETGRLRRIVGFFGPLR